MRVDVTAVLGAGASAERTAEVRAALERSTVRPGALTETTAPPATAPATGGWLWLLPDGAVPEPTALEELLACAAQRPDAALLGPALVDAREPRRLLELGLTVDAAGRRRTGVEPGELDQGQHDGAHEVLAVSCAGALVRREAWTALGGLDPGLSPESADVDLGWRVRAAGRAVLVVPAARVRRPARPRGPDGSARLVPLLHVAGARLPLALLRSAVAVLLHTVVLLLTRRPRAAAAELRTLRLLVDLPALRTARRRRRDTRTPSAADVGPLLVRPGERLRARLADTVERIAGAAERPRGRLHAGPATVLGAGLAVVALLAERPLLGAGRLAGGHLVPLPDSAAALWTAYVGPDGSARLGVLALLASVAGGRTDVVVELLLLATVPLAGVTAWSAAGRVVRAPLLRSWLAVTWALLPAVTGTLADGRLDRAVLAVALPLLLAQGWSVLADDPRPDGWRRAWGLALLLLIVGALAPQVLLTAAVLLLVPAGVAVLAGACGARRRAAACATAVLAPSLVLLPEAWATTAWATAVGGTTVGGTAAAGGRGAGALPVVDLLLAPGPVGIPPGVLCAGLLLAAAVGLLRAGRPRLALGGWGLALSGLLPGVDPAVGLLLLHAGLLLAVVACAAGLPATLARASFGRRQLAALVVSAAAAVVPVLCAAAWLVVGADGPVARRTPLAVPAFVRADLDARTMSALVLRPRADGAVGAAVTGPDGAPLTGIPVDRTLVRAAGDLLAGGESGAAETLGRRGIAWVALADARPRLASALDAEPGLSRQPAGSPLLWRVTATVSAVEPGAPETARVVGQGLALLVLVVLAAAPTRPPAHGQPEGGRLEDGRLVSGRLEDGRPHDDQDAG